MKCTFLEQDYTQRLDNTVCRWMGNPFYIRVDGRLCRLYNLEDVQNGGRPVDTIDPKHDDFDVSSIPLGYLQLDNTRVGYVMRRPGRIYKQGVNSDNLRMKTINNKQEVGQVNIFSKAFADMARGSYAPLEQVINELLGSYEPIERALSNDIALRVNPKLKLIYVYYKCDQVGIIPEGSRTVMIPSGDLAWIVSKNLEGYDWEIQ